VQPGLLWLVGLAALRPQLRWGLLAGGAGLVVLAAANLLRLVSLVAIGARWECAFSWSHALGEALLAGTWLLLWSGAQAWAPVRRLASG
jgi:exosortase/archaeosortase family protein